MVENTVCDCSHRVFTDSEVDVSARKIISRDPFFARNRRFSRAAEVCVAAYEPGNCFAESSKDSGKGRGKGSKSGGIDAARLINEGVSGGTEEENKKLIEKLTVEMTKAAKDLDFERAAEIRDIIIELKGKK